MSRRPETVLGNVRSKIPEHSRLLVAVSGGIDSVTLLHAIVYVARLLKLTVEVAHIDHGVRSTSATDAQFVETLAQGYQLPVHVLTLTGPQPGENFEAWARDRRYDFFSKICLERDLEFTATAHTADDVAETFLMRLVANKEPRQILAIDSERKLLRPLLTVTRAEIETYASQNNLVWVEDETNDDTDFLRNRVRHKVIPLLREHFDPRISEVLAIRASNWSEDDDFLNSIVLPPAERLAQLGWESPQFLAQFRAELELLPKQIQWRLAEQFFKPSLGFSLGRTRAREVIKVILAGRGQISFSHKILTVSEGGGSD